MNINELISRFKIDQMSEKTEDERIAEELRSGFVKDYPIDSVVSLSMEDYCSFCHRLRYDLQRCSSMGNAFPGIFEFYQIKNTTEQKMSPTYLKLFGTDFESAFSHLKEEIVKLLEAAQDNDYDTVAGCKINSLFKAKLISVYFPEKYVPVCCQKTLCEYCSRVGVSYSKKQCVVYGMANLSTWKNSLEDIRDWSNTMLMFFCDWLWRSNLSV